MPRVSQHVVQRLGQEGYGRQRHRDAALSADERDLAVRLRARCRMPWPAVSKAVGRTVHELRCELDPDYAKG